MLSNSPNHAGPGRPAFLTDRLALSAYLVSCGHEVALVETGTPKVLFAFRKTEELRADVAAFNSRTASVDPSTYEAARLGLRKRLGALQGGAR